MHPSVRTLHSSQFHKINIESSDKLFYAAEALLGAGSLHANLALARRGAPAHLNIHVVVVETIPEISTYTDELPPHLFVGQQGLFGTR